MASTIHVFFLSYRNIVENKKMNTDYANTENPQIMDMLSHTNSGMVDGENIANEVNKLLITLLGIFTYGSIIGLLSPLILVLLLISGMVSYLMLSYVRRYTEKNKDKWAHLDRKIKYLRKISSQYEHAKDIKIYGMKAWFMELTTQYQKLRMQWYLRIFNKNLLANLVTNGLRFIRDGVAYYILIGLVLDNHIDLGAFVFFLGAITGFSNWLSTIIEQFSTIANQSVNITRLRNYLDIKDTFNYGDGCLLPNKAEIPYDIIFNNVTYAYPKSDKLTLNKFDLVINKGEKLAVVGVNGAGKTTFVKLLCGLYYPSSGDILLNGKNMREYNIEEYYTQFSAVFQDVNLLPIPIAEFVAASSDQIDENKVREVLTRVGLHEKINTFPNNIHTYLVRGVFEDSIDLSGGEKQKLLLARALYKNAPVIVLDEPTAALDPIIENEIYKQYAELTAGKTSIFISHRLSSTRFSDRIIFIDKGKIVEVGSHEELMAKGGLYENMFNIQSHYYKNANTPLSGCGAIVNVKGEVPERDGGAVYEKP
jgi:ABC-type multidrug transport system fused ATPase/permease subunit